MLLFDFTHHNIEMAVSLLETCGRFLYRMADSHQRVKVYLVSIASHVGCFDAEWWICETTAVTKKTQFIEWVDYRTQSLTVYLRVYILIFLNTFYVRDWRSTDQWKLLTDNNVTIKSLRGLARCKSLKQLYAWQYVVCSCVRQLWKYLVNIPSLVVICLSFNFSNYNVNIWIPQFHCFWTCQLELSTSVSS